MRANGRGTTIMIWFYIAAVFNDLGLLRYRYVRSGNSTSLGVPHGVPVASIGYLIL